MKRPNKQDYNFLDSIDIRRFADDMIKWGDYVDNNGDRLEEYFSKVAQETGSQAQRSR